MTMNKKTKRRIKRGVDFNKEMAKGKFGYSEVASKRLGFCLLPKLNW